MDYLPTFPIHFNAVALFGLVLLLGLVGGEVARRIRFFPKISGYIAIGFLLGPHALNLMSNSVLLSAHMFVDISLGIILFKLGRCLDFSWLREDRGLLPTSLAESGLTFITICLFAHFIVELNWLPSALAGTFMIATSPAVILMVANDSGAQGPVTRRTITLTSLNNFFALTLFTFLLPITQFHNRALSSLLIHDSYLLLTSAAVAIVIFLMLKIIAVLTGKDKTNQFILYVAAIVLTIGIAKILYLPVALTLFVLGVATRNLDRKHSLMEIDFGWSTQLFFVLLFVITGTYLKLENFTLVAVSVIGFILIRTLAKMTGIWLFSGKSRLTKSQVFAIGIALTPMAGLAMNMSSVLNEFNPEVEQQIALIITIMVGILEILGPIATQLAFIKSRETSSDRLQ